MQLLLIYHMEVFKANLTVYLQRHLQLKKKEEEKIPARGLKPVARPPVQGLPKYMYHEC